MVAGGAVPPGWQLVESCVTNLGYDLIPLLADDVILGGAEAVLDRGVEAIFFRGDVEAETATAFVAHEIGHLDLHEAFAVCDAEDVEISSPEDPAAVGAHRVEAYGVRERDELQANVYARELLLPRTAARRLFLDEGLKASEIASRQGLKLDVVRQQLCDALLIPESPESDEGPRAPAVLKLDPTQRAAAEHHGSPLLLEAGPGTGKTRTLVARIVHLLEEGADPASILALTFSNKAAREITERVAESLPREAPLIWAGTFHAFGLELLRKHHDLVGLEPEVRIFDRSDSIELLEDRLPTLGLKHHQNLYEPALELKEILAAVSRAKDELVDAAPYQALAEAMLVKAASEDERKAAERALEVARVYEVYQRTLREKRAVDFGDLIMVPMELLEARSEVREVVRERFRHVLVDEYQDVNRASARFLKAIAGDGRRLWVVGDSRQSIYRFRGASSANMALFEQDFPGSVKRALGTSYRSTPEIVEAMSGFSTTIRASKSSLELRLETSRDSAGEGLALAVVDDAESEIAAVAGRLGELYERGVALSRQAVLCRSNAGLSAYSEGLEARGLPVLHLGSLFEREEVRDMLALLSLVAEAAGAGLMRVAAFADYAVEIADVRTFLKAIREKEIKAFEGLQRLDEVEGLSAKGREGLARLARHLSGIEKTAAPWNFLATYVFDRSDYLLPMLRSGATQERMRAVALYQFLNFLRGPTPGGKGLPARRLLARVRRLVLLGEERDLRQIPAAALHLDAVRLMTIHGSKGLEFEAVHLPSLMSTGLPAVYRAPRCPPPEGLVTRASQNGDVARAEREMHEEEEECLFFVALSRARTYLDLYRPKKTGRYNRKPSIFLARLDPPPEPRTDPHLVARLASPPDGVVPLAGERAVKIDGSDVTMFERCPRRYFYSRVFGLAGSKRDGAFVKTHEVIYHVLDTLRDKPETVLDREHVFQLVEEAWKRSGPVGHAFEADYRHLVERIVSNLVAVHTGLDLKKPEALMIRSPRGQIAVAPDVVAGRDDGSVLLRVLRTGRKGAFKGDDTIFGLFQESALARYGPGGFELEVVHLTDRGLTPIEMSARKVASRLEKGQRAVERIAKGRFPASPDPVSCPRCPFFFVCPAVPSGKLVRGSEEE